MRKVYAAPLATASPSDGGWPFLRCQLVVIFEAKHLKRLALPTSNGQRRRKLVICRVEEPRPGFPPVVLGNDLDDCSGLGEDKAGPDGTLAYSRLMLMNTPPCKTLITSIRCASTSARM